MSDNAVPWLPVAFVVAFAGIVALTGVLGLYRRDGVRHQNRNVYGIAIATFFLAIMLVMAELQAEVRWIAAFVAQAVIFAAVLSVAAIRLTRVFSYWHVAQLERELGHPLMETPVPKPSQF